MKPLKYLIAVAALAVGLTLSAKADLQDLGGVAFTGNNSPDSDLAALAAFGVDTTGFVLCGNSDNGDFGNPITNPITVMAGSYLVVHYGTGDGGTNPGGQLEFFHVVNGETSVDVPLTGPGPFGVGGISSIREFCPPGGHVPDNGTTAALLGLALSGLAGLRARFGRK
jgi:VPDSG-CTERM motif